MVHNFEFDKKKLHLVTEMLGPFIQAYSVYPNIVTECSKHLICIFKDIYYHSISVPVLQNGCFSCFFVLCLWPNSSLENIYQDNLPHILLQDCQVDPLLQMFTSICFSSCYRILNHKGYFFLGGGYTKKEPTVTGGSISSNLKRVNLPS